MVARTCGAVLIGVEARLVDVETDVSSGIPGVTLVGLAERAVNEARERVRAAVVNSEAEWPRTRITIALLPASWHKRGSSLDLPMAISILADTDQVPVAAVAGCLVIGELGLDGSVRPVPGVIAAALAAREAGIDRLIVPAANAGEAALLPGVEVVGIAHLRQLIDALRGDAPWPDPPGHSESTPPATSAPDLADVRGQYEARKALEIAAAGGHHLSMIGTPGVGKTLLAERLPGLLPRLGDEAALEVTSISSSAGRQIDSGLIRTPPFEAPHHSASPVSITGGGASGKVRIGAITLAHHGVLFLDEAPEFDSRVLEALRQPLERGQIEVHRADVNVVLPAGIHLVIAANPCPCGHGMGRGRDCTCSPAQRRRYASRLSGPVLDRIDLRLILDRPSVADLRAEAEKSAPVAERVRVARERAEHRWREERRIDGQVVKLNGQMPGPTLRCRFPPTTEGQQVLHRAFDSGALTLRGADRVLRVAWTLADLAGRDRPGRDDIGYAMSLRGEAWGWAV